MRKSVTITPNETAAYIKKHLAETNTDSNNESENQNYIALVFGNERTGLEKEELNICNIASHIPASNEFPSFNLSHAVQIYCYEIFLALSEEANKSVTGTWVPVTNNEIEKLSSDICNTLSSIGFYKIGSRDEHMRFFTDLLARSGITKSESRYLYNIFTKAVNLSTKAAQ
jgi:tRNA/rRNA methyltransferase/tRNA (cytidine32/uridine32-2'-O)-methyltransferase